MTIVVPSQFANPYQTIQKPPPEGGREDVVRDVVKDSTKEEALQLARSYFRTRPDIINRLFMGLRDINIPDPADSNRWIGLDNYLGKLDYKKRRLVPLLNILPEDLRKSAFSHFGNMLADVIHREIYLKKVPLEVFEAGAICYGVCDKICYWGQYYLSMCELRAKAIGDLPSIDWSRVNVRFYVNHLDKIMESYENIQESLDNVSSFETLPSCQIANYTGDFKIVMWNKNAFPCAISGAEVTYGDIVAHWKLDRTDESLKINRYGGEVKSTSQYFIRPVAIATIRALKELAKKVYMGKLDIYDGGDDDFETIINQQNNGNKEELNDDSPSVKAVQSCKEDFAAQRLRELSQGIEQVIS